MFKAACIVGMISLCCIFTGSAAAANFAFTGSADRSGDRSGPLEMANDFIVTSSTGINVGQLGFFIDGYDGLFVTAPSETHIVRLYNRANGTIVASATIGTSFNTFDGPYSYVHPLNSQSTQAQTTGGWGYVNITPVFLPSGFQGSIVAYTMSDSGAYVDDYGESVQANTGGGLISFTHSFLLATSATSGDPTGGSSAEAYGAGSFSFTATPAPEPAIFGIVGLGGLLALRRRRAAAPIAR